MEVMSSSETFVLSKYIASLLHEIIINLGFRNIKTYCGSETYTDLSVLQTHWIFLFVKGMSCGG